MATFRNATKETRAPCRVLLLPPTCFKDEWEQRPSADIAVGLRLLSDSDERNVREGAAKEAARAFVNERGVLIDKDGFVDAFNDGLVMGAVSRTLCDPNDVRRPHELFPMPDDLVPLAFTSAGARFVWDTLVEETVRRSPIILPATDEEVAELRRLLRLGALDRLEPGKAIAARKLLAAVLEDLAEVAGHLPVPLTDLVQGASFELRVGDEVVATNREPADDDDEIETYTIKG